MIATNVIGNNLKEHFFDDYQEEVLCCCDIISLVSDCGKSSINITVNPIFLKRMAKSHVYFIREFVEKCPKT